MRPLLVGPLLALLVLVPTATAQGHEGHTHSHAHRDTTAAPAHGHDAPHPHDGLRAAESDRIPPEWFMDVGPTTSHDHGAHGEAPATSHEHAAAGHPNATHGAATGSSHEHGTEGGAASTGMSSAFLPGAPMTRDGSGTAWLPDAAPMEAAHGAAGGWHLMLHGAVFPRFTASDAFGSGSRGASGFGAPNWAMGMAQRPVGAGQLTARAMVSLDPLIEGGDGYPLLFQTGETFEGEALVDRQHPHDFFSELSVAYAHRLGRAASAFAYLAYPGEPALGPVAFMHRPSARFSPDSPLGHHWQDATHIVFGVVTLGLATGPFKLDASVFTGREPNEERYGFDRPRFDSYSARLSVNPSPRWALQVSRGFLREPEAVEPGVDVWRTTASALYSAPVARGGDFSAALVWGLNDHGPSPDPGDHHHTGAQHALLGEAALRLGPQAVYSRAEFAQKSAAELALDPHAYEEERFDVLSLTLGTARELAALRGVSVMLGGQGSVYAVPEALRSLYGEFPVSLQVFLRLAPGRMAHEGAHAHH
ncbi:MAG TPA: hypothetical protein VD962_05165 [Rubricoccaceae bacterium]|nr:hypothetical protein [Rubricoccaceae bacterium]